MASDKSKNTSNQKDTAQQVPAAEKKMSSLWAGLAQRGKFERKVLSILMILGILYTLYFARGFLLPIFVALVLSFVLQPLVRGLSWFKLPAGLSAAIVIGVTVFAIGFGVYYLSGPAANWINRGPVLRQQLEYKFKNIRNSFEEARKTSEKLEEMADLENKETPEVVVKESSLADKVFSLTTNTIVTLMIITILTYFLLWRGQETLVRIARSLSGSRRSKDLTQIMLHIEHEISLYLQTFTIINLVLGAATAGILALLGMPNPILWGVAGGILNFLPYLGPAITIAILSVVSILTFDVWFQMILPPLIYAFLTILEGQIITPIIIGKRLSLDPVLIFISVLFWGWLWGVVGVLLAVPTLSALKIIFSRVELLKPYEKIFG